MNLLELEDHIYELRQQQVQREDSADCAKKDAQRFTRAVAPHVPVPERTEEYVKGILANKDRSFRDSKLHEILTQFASILEQQNIDMVCSRSQIDVIPAIVRSLNIMCQSSERDQYIRLGICTLLGNISTPIGTIHQCVELMQCMLLTKYVRDEFSFDETTSLVTCFVHMSKRYDPLDPRFDWMANRIVIGLMSCMDALCKCRKLQAINRVFPDIGLTLSESVVYLLSYCNESTVVLSCLELMEHILDFNVRLQREQNIDFIFLNLLGHTVPDIVSLSGKLLVKHATYHKERFEENGTWYKSVVRLLCKNIITQTHSGGDAHVLETYLTTSCKTLLSLSLIEHSDSAKRAFIALLKELDTSLLENGDVLVLSNPVEQVMQIRDRVRSNPALFRQAIDLYNRSLIT